MSIHPTRNKRTDKDDRGTPPALFEALHAEYGFTVDVAASADNARLPRYYDKEADGLAQSWAGEVVWCNPPYTKIAPWLEKAVAESAGGACKVVCLLPATTEVRWFHRWALPYARLVFLPGRLSFEGAGGGHAPFGSLLAIYGE